MIALEPVQEAEWGVGALAGNPDERIPAGNETRRLALVDLDWDHVRALDILAVLRSFLAKVPAPVLTNSCSLSPYAQFTVKASFFGLLCP